MKTTKPDRLIHWCQLPPEVLAPMTPEERAHAIAIDDLRIAFTRLATASRARTFRAWGLT